MTFASVCKNSSEQTAKERCDVDVRRLFDLSETDLRTEQKDLVYRVLEENIGVIGTNELDLGLTNTIEHRIELEQPDAIKQPYRRFPAPLQKELEKEVQKLLDLEVIEPSTSSWSSPLVPVRKKDGSLRMCIDYRALNARTKKDSFPLPNLSDSIQRFKECRYFSSLDLLSGYHQIAVEASSREFTAFSDGKNLYQYARLPFGVCNGPASFSRLVAVVLSGIPFDVAQAYLDDIIVAGRDFDEHLKNIRLVFARLASHGLKLNARKCTLFRSEVEYLGHVVGRDGIKPLNKNVQAILEYPQPTTVKQLRSYNGMVNYYKKFIENSQELMRPLYRATAGKKLVWTKDCTTAFQRSKEALINTPVLAYPDFKEDAQFIVTCDASAYGAGAILSQIQQGEERVLGYAGTSFNQAQMKYSPTDRELAAIRFAVIHFKALLYGRKFIIRTDHEPLLYLYHMRRFDDRLHRTLEDMNIGHYELEYVPGKNNVVADALSRARYPWTLPEDDSRVCWEPSESLDQFTRLEIKGGGDSLFVALGTLLGEGTEFPLALRDRVTTDIRKNPTRYGFQDDARGRREMELLREAHYFPPLTALQAISDHLGSKIVVYFEDGPILNYKPRKESAQALYLLCRGGVHFDALKLNGSQPEAVKRIGAIQHNTAGPVTLDSTDEEIAAAQGQDADLCALRRIVETDSGEVLGPTLAPFESKRIHLSVDDYGLLNFRTAEGRLVPVVPASSVRPLAIELHEVISHAGRDKTKLMMRHKFFHPDFVHVIPSVIRECRPCQKHKGNTSNKHPVFRRRTEHPYAMYAIDCMDLPKSRRGNKCVLTGIDLHSKFAHAVPLRNKRANTVARALERHVLATVPRVPRVILSDHGPEFRAATMRKLLDRYGISHEFSVPYAPNCNGAIERFNQTLKSRLATACSGDKDTSHWDRHLDHILAQYNQTNHTQTGKSPAEFFIRDSEVIVPSKPKKWRDAPKFKSFAAGDLIMRRVPYQTPGERDKLSPKFQGPLQIITVDPNGITYRAKFLEPPYKIVQVHHSQIKRFYGPCPLSAESRPPKQSLPTAVKTPADSNRNIFDLNLPLLNILPCHADVPENRQDALSENPSDPTEYQSVLGTPIRLDWSGFQSSPSHHSSDDGVISDGCVPHTAESLGTSSSSVNLAGIIPDTSDEPPVDTRFPIVPDEVPNTATSTPTNRRGQSMKDLGISPVPEG
ncbi:MAG: reverse transcriptase domain-containing protein, partial [Bacteroidota bacterium]